MANPINTTNLSVSEETYNRLKKIKEINGWTFNEVISQLCELELQHNYIDKIISYELYYNDIIYPFRVTFKKENMVIEYYNGETYSDKIKTWGLDDKIAKAFYEFINIECSRCMLYYMPVGLIFKEFDIYKVG